MELLAQALIFLLAILVFAGRQVYKNVKFGKKYKLPPAVPGIPVFGNTFQLPLSNQGEWARAQARKYGEM